MRKLKTFTIKYPLITILITGVLILILPYIFTRTLLPPSFTFGKDNPIGDTFGGITAPFIGLLSAYLVYISFTAQVKANEKIALYRHEDIIINSLENTLSRIEKRIEDFKADIFHKKIGFSEYSNNKVQLIYNWTNTDTRNLTPIEKYVLNEELIRNLFDDEFYDLMSIHTQFYNFMSYFKDCSLEKSTISIKTKMYKDFYEMYFGKNFCAMLGFIKSPDFEVREIAEMSSELLSISNLQFEAMEIVKITYLY